MGKCSLLEELYVSTFPDQGKCAPLCFVQGATSLLRYRLQLGEAKTSHLVFPHVDDDDSIARVLQLHGFDVSTIDGHEKNLLQTAEDIQFSSLRGGFRNIVPDIDQAVGCMNELNRLYLESCSEIECLFDATPNRAGPFQGDVLLPCRLITLRLEWMENLKEVCRGEPPLDFFKKLEELHIRRCPQLQSIFPRQCNLGNLKILSIYDIFHGNNPSCGGFDLFSMSVARNMLQLEELTIGKCPELKHVISTEVEDGANTREEISSALNHSLFPKLKTLEISQCPQLQFIFPISCVECGG